MIERWLAVEDLPYEVSDFGRVRRSVGNQGTVAGHILKLSPHDHGYLRVSLCAYGVYFYRYVHILVLTAFVGPCPPGHETNHKDGVKTNNTLLNLEWKTGEENREHAIETGLYHPRAVITHCSKGHFKDKVTGHYVRRSGEVVERFGCRECINARRRKP